MDYQKLINKAEKTVTGIVRDSHSPVLLFHNSEYINYIVKSAEKIASYSDLDEQDHFVLIIAARFHEIGQVIKKSDPSISIRYAKEFLAGHEVPENLIERVTKLITASGSGQDPESTIEKILHDALTYYYGKKSCFDFFENERKEIELINQSVIEQGGWLKGVLSILRQHQFFTIYCLQTLEEGKKKNIEELETKVNHVPSVPLVKEKPLKNAETIKSRSEKGIDAMFRIAESNSQRLSSMADNKAHILITVNSIILSAVISILLRKLDDNRDLILPTILLLAVSLTSMSFSILATRPSLPRLTSRPILRETENVNLLFFGNFYHMSLEDYNADMHKMMGDVELVYNCLIKDVHTEGKVLARKYKLLRTSYNIFMFGLIVATVAFLITTVIQPRKLTTPAATPNKAAMPAATPNKVSLHHF